MKYLKLTLKNVEEQPFYIELLIIKLYIKILCSGYNVSR